MKKNLSVGVFSMLIVLLSALSVSAVTLNLNDQNVDPDNKLSIDLKAATSSGIGPYIFTTNSTFGSITEGVFTWIPIHDNIGVYSVKFNVNDTGNITSPIVSDTIKITVNPNMLKLQDITVWVDGEKDTGVDEECLTKEQSIDKDVRPGSKVEIEFELKSMFNDDNESQDIKIEDIEITAILKDIDDGSDIEEEATIDDIDPGKKESAKVTFNLPKLAKEDKYDIDVKVIGEDENNKKHKLSFTLTLDLKRKTYDLKIDKTSLSPSIVTCSRDVKLDLEIINIGDKSDDEIVVTAKNSKLNLDFSEKSIELDSDPDEDYKYSKRLNIAVPSTLAAGTYPIEIDVYYSEDIPMDAKTVDLVIENCVTTTTPPATTPPIITPVTAICGNNKCELGESTTSCPTDCPYVAPVTTAPATGYVAYESEEKPFLESWIYIAILIAAVLAALTLSVVLIVKMVRGE